MSNSVSVEARSQCQDWYIELQRSIQRVNDFMAGEHHKMSDLVKKVTTAIDEQRQQGPSHVIIEGDINSFKDFDLSYQDKVS